MNLDSWLAVGLAGVAIVGYHAIGRCFLRRSRRQRLIFMLKRSALSLGCYAAIIVLLRSYLPAGVLAIVSALPALGIAHILVRRTRREYVKSSSGTEKSMDHSSAGAGLGNGPHAIT
jgi:hypothetical protein